MSLYSNQTILEWQDVEALLHRRAPQYFQGTTALGSDAREIVCQALMLWYLVTWDTLNSFGTPLARGTVNRWIVNIETIPLRELVDSLKLVSHLLVSGDFPNYDAFKQHLRESFPFIGAILAPVREIIDHWYRESDIDALNLSYSWACFISRLNLPGLSDLEREALDNYLRLEESILEDGFTSEERSLLEEWFPRTLLDRSFLEENFRPQHGPGSTADAGNVLQDKYASLGIDLRISYLHNRVYGVSAPYPRQAIKGFERCSRTIFVPKALGSYRTISMEPATLMWHQKGVRNSVLALLKSKKHYLLRRYQPDDQQPNCDLAWQGSLDGSFATVDLSSASDTVSWSLVKRWFGNTSLYPWLLCTRSTHTLLPNGSVIKLRKYAPMGSDLCFPVETIIFAAIVECSIREFGDDPKKSKFRVYGDDIVVEDRYAPLVLKRLVQNGFSPNWEKTFSGSQPQGYFRESCGGFFFNGADITPVRLSRRFDGYAPIGADTPERIESLIELANESYFRYPSVRRWCVSNLLSLPQSLRPPFSSDGNFGLFSTEPTNFHLIKKESHFLQSTVYTFGYTHVPRRARRICWEDIRYFEYLRQADGRQRLVWPDDRISVDVSPIPRSSWYSKSIPLY